MLVLTGSRKKVCIGDNITITIVRVKGSRFGSASKPPATSTSCGPSWMTSTRRRR